MKLHRRQPSFCRSITMIKVSIIVFLVEFVILYAEADVCQRPNFDTLDDTFINKDMDICTMFIQSYTRSIDMNQTIKNYLLRHLPYTYISDGHLHRFSQYENDYSFLLASTINKIEIQTEDHQKSKYKQNVTDELDKDNQDESYNEINYEFIDWSQSSTEIYQSIVKNFHISEECNSIVTLYLTFPSYPQDNGLVNFLEAFQGNTNKTSSSSINGNQNLQYRPNINPSFLSIVDQLPLAVFQQLLEQQPNIRLVFCGHALGGTIAQLSTLHLVSKGIQSHRNRLRSISIGSLFFSKQLTIEYVKNHHFEKHFINIYHELDSIPVLFNSAEFLSYLIQTDTKDNSIWSWFLSYVGITDDLIKEHRSTLTHVMSWLCSGIAAKYSRISPKICNPEKINAALTGLQQAVGHIRKYFFKDKICELVYQPIGIYNMITFRKLDRTWHLVNVNNEQALYDHLNNTLERLLNSNNVFENHSIETYLTDLQQANKQTTELNQIRTMSNLFSSPQSNENYSIIIPLPFRFSVYSEDQLRTGKSYATFISEPPVYPFETQAVHRSPSRHLETQLISAFKHRTGILEINANNLNETKKIKAQQLVNAYDVLLNIYDTYGIDARMEMMKLQLDQRMLVPILVSRTKRNQPPFRSYIKTLSLVEIPILHLNDHLLAFDSNLLRIGLISTIKHETGGLPDFMQDIFHATSVRSPISGTGEHLNVQTVVEIGYGFLREHASSYEPIILVHVIGDYRPLTSFLSQYVDGLIVEYNEDSKEFGDFQYSESFNSLRVRTIMKWKHTINAKFNGIEELDEPHPMNQFKGTAKAVADAFQKHLLEILHSQSFKNVLISHRPRLIDIIQDEKLFWDDDVSIVDINSFFNNTNTSFIKKEVFKLQQSYKIEAENQLQLDNPSLQLQERMQKEFENNIRRERKFRVEYQQTVTENSLFQSYLSIITEPNDEKRYVNKRNFESVLSEFNEKTISVWRNEKDQTFNAMTNAVKDVINAGKNSSDYVNLVEKQKQATEEHYNAKQEFISNSLVPEHFWREISHLYVVNSSVYSTYPHLAAQHIIDGFPLELLDGDSMLLNTKWLEAVFDSLNKKLHKQLNKQPRILVLSITGPQSSGKSFLLKTMYGIRIRSSVGACTQGVNMMLVQVYEQEYDYVLLIDTEGIRAPEFMNLPGAELRDNTLVTFSILPADGTILLNKGEVNQALEEILPIVLYVYATSSLSLQLGGQIPSKLFFVYNQIDTSQEAKGKELLQDLTTRLYNVTDKIRESLSSENTTFHGFEQCRLDLTNISNSDFRILTVNTNNPPVNHPVNLYGEQVLQLRQWIDKRITNQTETHTWRARSFSDIFEYLKVAIDTIRQAHYITNINTALEMLAYNKLNQQIELIKYNVSAAFTATRMKVEDDIIKRYTNRSNDESNINTLSEMKIKEIIKDGHAEVLKLMSNITRDASATIRRLVEGTKRKIALRDAWDSFLKEKEDRVEMFLATRIDREITIEFIIDQVQNKIRKDLIKKCNEINCTDLNNKTKESIFDEIYNERIKEVQEPYKSGNINVSHSIKTVYNKTFAIEQVKFFGGKQFCNNDGLYEWEVYEENELKHQKNVESETERADRLRRLIEEKKKFHNTIDEIISLTNTLGSTTQRYDELMVNQVLTKLEQIIHDRSISSLGTRKNVHRRVFCYLEYYLTDLQNKWDSEHNRTVKIEKKRGYLWDFFGNVSNGIRGIKLLELELFNVLQKTWKSGFIEVLTEGLKTTVAQKKWIRDSDILGAYIDNEKIQILENYGIDSLLGNISSANQFYEKCVEKLIQTIINESVEEKWTMFYNDTKNALDYAKDSAKKSSKNCLQTFLDKLKNSSSTLPEEIKSNIPSRSEIYGNVTDQEKDIFDTIVTNIMKAIPENPESKLNGNESQTILKKIRQDPATDSAKPRCNHACALCGAPCFKHANHTDYHDFYHQPAGISGVRYAGTNRIVHDTCHESYVKKLRFTIDGGRSYHDFTEFPTLLKYETPVSGGKRNLLSEYLMGKYHKKIAEYYGLKPNPPVPVAFEEYTLDYIKNKINKTINP